ncbi:hypothetical protein AERO8C_20503 [Aeromonas veronii]|uniref:Uncharacterized protein n=1 Tax=Aeromonas veronii TaxID=654 RepID=A0A653L241_AERVE|nr:hypothetical protein AERO8C_20503 [Aeromonas veronii]
MKIPIKLTFLQGNARFFIINVIMPKQYTIAKRALGLIDNWLLSLLQHLFKVKNHDRNRSFFVKTGQGMPGTACSIA